MVLATCAVNRGDLPLDIIWVASENGDMKNSRRVITNDGVVITRTSSRISTLSIEQVRGRHSSNYTCICKNNAGTTQHTAELLINGYCL